MEKQPLASVLAPVKEVAKGLTITTVTDELTAYPQPENMRLLPVDAGLGLTETFGSGLLAPAVAAYSSIVARPMTIRNVEIR
ncbi:MAG: hypothetical protein ACXVQZ_02030 [Gaiellaceae bacterium]